MAAPHCLHEGLRLAQNPSRLRLLLESKHQPRSGADSLANMGGKAPGRASRSSMVSWPWLYYLAKERFRVVAIGQNLGRVISSVTSVKTTSTGVPTSMSSILHCLFCTAMMSDGYAKIKRLYSSRRLGNCATSDRSNSVIYGLITRSPWLGSPLILPL